MSRPLIRKIRRDLLRRRGALVSLLAIVAVGLGCFAGMAGVWRDLDRARARYYTEYRLADFSVSVKRAPESALHGVQSIGNVRSIEGRVRTEALLDLSETDLPITGLVISAPEKRQPVLNDLLLQSGTWFSGENEEEAILNNAFAEANRLGPGSRLKVLLPDGQHDVLVVGTAMSPEFVYVLPPAGGLVPDPKRFGVMYMEEDFLRRACDLQGAYNEFLGTVYDDGRTELDNTLELISDRLDAYGVLDTTPSEEQPSVRFLEDELTGLKVSATFAPTIFLGVAALILNVLMARLIAQQRTTIGTLKALGYSRSDVVVHYLAYGVAIGVAGSVAGIALGIWIQKTMLAIYREFYALPAMTRHFYPAISMTGVGLCVGFSVLGTLRGVRKAARLEPAEAMRPPPPEKGGRILPEAIPALWQALSFRMKLILRTIFRNPFRSTVSMLSAGISASLIFSTLSMKDALDYMMEYEFSRISHQDMSLILRDPLDDEATAEIKGMVSIGRAEAHLSIGCELRNGPRKKRTGITGLPMNGSLYTPLNRQGDPIVIPSSGLVLTKKLAEILDVSVGDVVRVRPLIGERREVEAPVVGIVQTFLGLSAYANRAYLSRLIGEVDSTNSILTESYAGEAQALLTREVRDIRSLTGIERRLRALEQLRDSFGATMGGWITTVVLFAGLIAFGSVLNAAIVSLSERQREVGTLRVLGYTPAQVLSIFSGESLLLNAIGLALGFAGGYALSLAMGAAYSTEIYRFPVVIKPTQFMLTALLMLCFVGLAQLAMYRMIRKLNWLDVLNVKE